MKITWLILEININNLWTPVVTYAEEIYVKINLTNIGLKKKEEQFYSYDCEKERDLFLLKQKLFLDDSYPGEISGPRNYYIKKIPHSNLLFVAINETMPKPLNVRPITTSPRKIIYDESFDYSCQKLELNNLARRRLAGCYNEHPLESEIKICGRGTRNKLNLSILVIFLLSLTRQLVI
jgi:hypothetical protein